MVRKKNLRSALGHSLREEEEAVDGRFAKAEAYFGDSAPSVQPEKPAYEKVIRDGFTMPASDYELIVQLQAKSLGIGITTTKSEVVRAGLHALNALAPEQLTEVVRSLEKVKTGRPSK